MKYWKVLVAAAMVFALSSCGGGGDGNDKTDPPPPPPGTPNSLIISASTPQLNESGQLSVQFSVTDQQGKGYELGTTLPSFTLAKVIPGRDAARQDPVVWKSFIYNTRNNRPTGESSGKLEPLGNGQYRYTFSFNATTVRDPYPSDSLDNNGLIRWDEAATHRLGIYFGGSNGIPVTDYVLDWVPAGTPPLLTRDILAQQSCDSCHMKQPIHHGNRADPKLCVTCHNESVPGSGRGDLTTLVHKLHGNLDPKDTKLVSHFPQDPRNCDTCHKDVTPTTPNANNWQHAQEKPCGACHADSTMETGYVSHINGKIKSGALCTQCHAEEPGNTKSPSSVHMGYLAN
uniref:OmcA/MtrC family decaheme c-type cytochrome n=1 Tax=Aeromonas sp. TaxID=647 RepID=UPI00257A47F0